MKKIFSVILFLLSFACDAQHNDNVWLIGYHYCQGCPIPALDFTYGHPDTVAVYAPFDQEFTNASICDSSGLLQFYTSGILIGNKYGQLLAGSTDFNLDDAVTYFGWTYYMPFFQCSIALPFPGHQNQYYLFHLSGRTWNNYNNIQPCRMAYSTIDMSANGGTGQMILKNQTAINDTLLYSTMQAVKHGNGRDWWIVAHEYNSSGMYAALLTPDSIISVVHSFTGPSILQGIFAGQSNFSPDGSKFAIASRDSALIYIYNFDRCSGEFSFDTLIRHVYDPNGYNLTSCIFSPNSRYLYASDYNQVYQFDTYASDIPASEKIVGSINGGASYCFRFCSGPDGKIYEDSWGSTQYLHVINDPDQADTACHFVLNQLKVMYYAFSLPDFPNYRLGELSSSGCDSLTNGTEATQNPVAGITVYPNPSKGIFQFYLSTNEYIKEISITDFTGRTKLIQQTKNEIDLSSFADGVYFYSVETNEGRKIHGTLLKIE